MNEEYEVMETEENEVYESEKDYSSLLGAGVLVAGGALAYKGGEILVKKAVIPLAKKAKAHIPFLNKKEEPDAEAPAETEVEVITEEEK